jgi:hypothetical protein
MNKQQSKHKVKVRERFEVTSMKYEKVIIFYFSPYDFITILARIAVNSFASLRSFSASAKSFNILML